MIVKDAIVIGGGPAGSATAMRLARGGMDVAVLEASHYETFRVGETLPPPARGLLESLELWDRLEGDSCQSSPGIVSIWGDETPGNNDFVFSPFGPGWHIDRVRFDRMMARSAEDAGALVMRGFRVTAATCRSEWTVEAAAASQKISVVAPVLIDASGRSGWRGRLAHPRRIYDRLVAFAGVFDGGPSGSATDQRTLIEAVANGWWYDAPIPDGRRVAAFFTDSDIPVGGRHGAAEKFKELLPLAPPRTMQRLRGYALNRSGAYAAAGTIATQVCGDKWIAVGDAACTFDPLSSYGLLHALQSSRQAANALLQYGSEREQSLQRYAKDVARTFKSYLEGYAYHYGRESRWPDSTFWRRRRSSFQLAERGTQRR